MKKKERKRERRRRKIIWCLQISYSDRGLNREHPHDRRMRRSVQAHFSTTFCAQRSAIWPHSRRPSTTGAASKPPKGKPSLRIWNGKQSPKIRIWGKSRLWTEPIWNYSKKRRKWETTFAQQTLWKNNLFFLFYSFHHHFLLSLYRKKKINK